MTKKIPHQKKKGAITREEKIDQHNEEIKTLNKSKKLKFRKIVHLVKNPRTMECETHIQTPRI